MLEGLEGGVGSEDLEPHHTFCFFFFSQLLCGDGNGSCQSVAPGTRLSLPVTMPPPRPDGLCHFGTASPINPFFVRLLVSRPHGLRPITKHFPPRLLPLPLIRPQNLLLMLRSLQAALP